MPVATELKYTVSLDSGAPLIALAHYLYTGDQQAHRIQVTCTRGGERVDLTGATVPAYFIRADSATVILTGTVEDGRAVVELPATCYAVAGRCSLVIKAVMGGATSTILALQGAVSRSQTDALVDPGDVLPSLDELLAQVQKVEEAVAKAEAIANMIVTVDTLPPGSEATAEYEVGKLHLGIPRGEQGEPGTPGQDGQDGAAATVQIGAVNTLPAGSAATVNNGGTDTAAILNFGIPQGPQGEQGVGITMMQTSRSEEDGGENTITFHLSDGTSKTFVVQNGHTGSKGDTGATGPQGQTGATGVGIESVTQTTTSSASGGTNIITVAMTDGSTYTFRVRNGAKGDTGSQGPQGDVGQTGPQGPQGATGETGERGYSVFFATNAIEVNPDGYYEIDPADLALPDGMDVGSVKVGDMVIGQDGIYTDVLYLYHLDSYDGGYYLATNRYRMTGETGPQGPQGEKGDTGATGPAGAAGATTAEVIAALTKETWTFTLSDGSTVNKVVPLI